MSSTANYKRGDRVEVVGGFFGYCGEWRNGDKAVVTGWFYSRDVLFLDLKPLDERIKISHNGCTVSASDVRLFVEKQTVSDWFDILKTPLPTSGTILLSITDADTKRSFTDVGYCDELGVMGKGGQLHLYRDSITHWQPMPQPMLTHVFN